MHPWFPGSKLASLVQPLPRRLFLKGEAAFLGFNEIIYCLLALTKTVNVTGEV